MQSIEQALNASTGSGGSNPAHAAIDAAVREHTRQQLAGQKRK